MNRTFSLTCSAAALGAVLASASSAMAGVTNAVDVDLSPASQIVFIGDIVEVHLIVSTDGLNPQGFDALDAIIGWDTTYLNLLGNDDSNAGATFFMSDFLPDPDGINATFADGDALYTAFAPPGSPVLAPVAPGNLIVTTFEFQALAATPGTDVVLIPQMGNFGQTRVLLEGVDITGDILGPVQITIIPAPGALALLGVAGLVGRRRRRD